MKKLYFWGLPVIILAFGLTVLGCDNDTTTDAESIVPTVSTEPTEPTFPSGFIGIWQRDEYTNTLTFTSTTLKASNQALAWNLEAVSDDEYTVKYSTTTGNTVTITINLVNDNLEISGDSGTDEDNWNGTWKKVTADGSSKEQAIPLSMTSWEDGSVAIGEAKWYKFEAASGTSYSVQWEDSYQKPDGSTYTGDIKVSAFTGDGTTPITGFQAIDSGWATPKTVSGVSGTVYLKVEPYDSTAGYAGTYAIRFYDPATVVPQVPMSISSANATSGPTVIVSWSYVSGVSGYRVYRSSSETGEYSQIGSDITNSFTISYTDTNVSAGNTYWYKVAAYNSVGEGEKSAAIQSGTIPNTNTSYATLLVVGAEITGGTISTETQADWYTFEAVSGTTYKVQCADALDKPDGSTYTAYAKVSAFRSDGTSITSIQNAAMSWSSLPKTISGVSGTVYLKVEAYTDVIFRAGTYGIKVSVDGSSSISATTLTVGAAITVGTISATTQVDWYTFTAVSGTTYSVQWADYYQKASGDTYTGDIKVSAFTGDGTTPQTVSGISGTVYLKVIPYNNNSSYFGTYGIKVTGETTLTVGAAITLGTISATTQVDWYKFTAVSGKTYNVQWADSYQKAAEDIYTGDIKVSAFTGDGTTPVTSFQNVDNGWTSPKTISGVSGTVYLKVEPFGSNSTYLGTYGIKVTEVINATTLTVGATITVGTLSSTTQVYWYKFTAVSGTTYSVQWGDKYEKASTDTYTGDIIVSAFTDDGTTPISSFQNVDNGWTSPKTISGVSGTVYLKVGPYNGSSNNYGSYGIKVSQQ